MNSAVRNITKDIEVSPGDFRDAMRRLTGGVSVITVLLLVILGLLLRK